MIFQHNSGTVCLRNRIRRGSQCAGNAVVGLLLGLGRRFPVRQGEGVGLGGQWSVTPYDLFATVVLVVVVFVMRPTAAVALVAMFCLS